MPPPGKVISITSQHIKENPALKDLNEQLTRAFKGTNLESDGAELGEQVPGDGIVQIYFGPVGSHGRQYQFIINDEGQVRYNINTQGFGFQPPEKPSTFSLNPQSTKAMLNKLLGPLEIRKTLITAKDARDYWDAELKIYDVTNESGTTGPDGKIDHVDIHALSNILGYPEIIEARKKLGLKPNPTPEEIKAEIKAIIAKHKKP